MLVLSAGKWDIQQKLQSLTHTGHLPQPDQGSAQRGLSPARAQPSEGSGRRRLNLQQKQHLRQQHPLQVAPMPVVLELHLCGWRVLPGLRGPPLWHAVQAWQESS